MKTLKVLGEMLREKMKNAVEYAIIIVLTMVALLIIAAPGMIIVAVFFEVSKETLFIGGWISVASFGLISMLGKFVIDLVDRVKRSK